MSSSYLFINNLRVHYLHWNLKEDKSTLILIHGLASNARIWELIASQLAEHGYKLLAPDARGHGLTDKPDNGYDDDTLTRDLAMFIQSCHLERPILVGHSWGGARALEYAARFPIGPYSPSGIVLLDGGMVQLNDDPQATWENVRLRLAPPNLSGTPLETFQENLKTWTADWLPQGEDGERIINIILSNFAIDEEERIKPHLDYSHHMQIVRTMWDYPTYQRFQRVRCPTLMLPVRPKDSSSEAQKFLELKERGIQRAQDMLSKLEVSWLEDTIHDAPLHKPAEVAELIAKFAKKCLES